MLIRTLLGSLLLPFAAGYDAPSRWGQACVVVNEALFVHGGKVDLYNQYSYTSAPNTNDVLYLSLSAPFAADAPPWQLVSSSANSSTSQGPALSWHSLSAFSSTEVLLFGGLPDPNSPTVDVDVADSGAILDVLSRTAPVWTLEPVSWAGEPVRRIRHSTATTPDGLVFVFGGVKPDGSQKAYKDHFYFDPNAVMFTPLPTDGAPPDIFGHVSIVLPDGKILVFGGFCPSKGSLLPFSTIYVYDSAAMKWSTITTDTSSLPSPRVAFVAVYFSGGKIIIHGGSDASFQNNFADGWVLDTTKNPWTWTKVDALSQLGPRRDHFAVPAGDDVVFGFGYGNNGPASPGLQVFDPSSNTFNPTFTPLPVTASLTRTIPQVTQTHTQASSPTGVTPTKTPAPTQTHQTSDDGDDKKRTTAIAVGAAFGILGLMAVGLGTAYYVRRRHRAQEGERQFMALGDDDDDDDLDSPHVARRIPAVRMHTTPPVRGGILNSFGLAGALGVTSRMRAQHVSAPRRDMLADEDARSFGEWYNNRRREGTGGSSWSLRSILGGGGMRTKSREASVTSYGGNLPTPWREKSDPFSDGAALMRDEETGFVGAAAVGAAGAVGGGGARPGARREFSYQSSMSGYSYRDPFVDPIHEEARERGSEDEDTAFDSTQLYRDHGEGSEGPERHLARPSIRPVVPLPNLQTVLPLSQGGHALSPLSEHTTPSQSTLPLQNFSQSGSSQGHSNDYALSPFDSNSRRSIATSFTSNEPTPPLSNASPNGGPGGGKSTSIIGASAPSLLATNQPMRRSDSWWTRFSRGGILDRRSSGGHGLSSRRQSGMGMSGYHDIRDPQPPPKLGAIEERSVVSSSAKSSPGSAADMEKQLGAAVGRRSSTRTAATPPSASSQAAKIQDFAAGGSGSAAGGSSKGGTPPSRANSASAAAARIYGGIGQHGKSMSSLRTADSEAIERMVGGMDVVQRIKTRSQRGSGSTSSMGGSVDTHGTGGSVGEHGVYGGIEEGGDNLILFASPVEHKGTPPSHPLAVDDDDDEGNATAAFAAAIPSKTSTPSLPPSTKSTPSSSSGAVADKVKSYERRMSMEVPGSPPPATNTRQREERPAGKRKVDVNYGLVPRQSLFVANPDRSGSGDTT